MHVLLLMIHSLRALFGAAGSVWDPDGSPQAGSVWDPNGKPSPQASGTWDPDG